MTCELCDHEELEEDRYRGDVCTRCGAIHLDAPFVEIRDVTLEVWQISERYDDDREPEWDTEYAARIYVGDEIETYGSDVHGADYTFDVRNLDEVGLLGIYISGQLHDTFISPVEKLRVRTDDEHEYIEASNVNSFSVFQTQRV